MGFVKRDPNLNSVKELVMQNTGMSEGNLINDSRTYEVTHLKEAVELIKGCKGIYQNGIRIFGDYDADGITSTMVLNEVFSLLVPSWRINVRFPKRFSEGYGAKAEAIREFGKKDTLLILVDNGIKAFEAVEQAKAMGMKVLILDHHEPKLDANGYPVLPKADVIVDPKVFHGDFDYYCGAGLALKLAEAMFDCPDFKMDIYEGWKDRARLRVKALAAIGTVCDQVPLVAENRRIVKEGLEVINGALQDGYSLWQLPKGLFSLMTELGLENVTEKSIGFKIGPCINAWGRLEDDGARQVYDRLSHDRYKVRALEKAKEIVAKNEERKELSELWQDLAVKTIEQEQMAGDYPIVLHMNGMPEGIAGLLAGKIAEIYETPAIVFSTASMNGQLKGSARSDGKVDINELLGKHSDLLVAYGGHKGAAGLSIMKQNLDDLRKALQAELGAKPQIEKGDTVFDLEIKAHEISSVMEDVLQYGPYGEGNPSPVFLVRNLSAIPDGSANYKELNRNGVKIQTAYASCLTFEASDKYRACGAPRKFDAAGTLSTNVYHGHVTNQFEFTDVEPVAETALKKSMLQLALEKKAAERKLA